MAPTNWTGQPSFFFYIHLGAFAGTGLVLRSYYFPSGVVYPKRLSRYIPWFILARVIGVGLNVAGMDPTSYGLATNPFLVATLVKYNPVLTVIAGVTGDATLVIGLIVGVVALILRYRQATPTEQQQIKWFAWAGTIVAIYATIVTFLHFYLYRGFLPQIPVIDLPFFVLSAALPPLSVGAAVLRYRLWDVNFLISRTVLYVTLTSIMAAIFAGSAAIINQLASTLFNSESGAPAAIVSTILIVTIFQPVRHEIEQWINERYFPENRELSRNFVEFSSEKTVQPLRGMKFPILWKSQEPLGKNLRTGRINPTGDNRAKPT